MARRRVEAARRIQQRKLQRAQEWAPQEWKIWRTCEVCEQRYCANNYQDRKVRLHRFRGIELCARCQYSCVKYLPKLQKLGAIKIKKPK